MEEKLKHWYNNDGGSSKLSKVFELYRTWWGAVETQAQLFRVDALKTTRHDLGRLQAILYHDYKEANIELMNELNSKYSVNNEFYKLFYELSAIDECIYLCSVVDNNERNICRQMLKL